jgi:O-antigen ligase
MFLPKPQEAPKWDGSQSVVDLFLYKGQPEKGIMGSRKGPWQQTWSVIKQRPWFGSGFGTSITGEDLTNVESRRAHIDSRTAREHGNSYLAIGEWTGLLGVVPFLALIGVTALNVFRVFSWLRKTMNLISPAVPIAAILLAGFVDTMFEDWMFAAGYYLCVIFWALAFILVDLVPRPVVAHSRASVIPIPLPYYAEAASGQ